MCVYSDLLTTLLGPEDEEKSMKADVHHNCQWTMCCREEYHDTGYSIAKQMENLAMHHRFECS